MKKIFENGYVFMNRHDYVRRIVNVYIPKKFYYFQIGLTDEESSCEDFDLGAKKLFEEIKGKENAKEIISQVHYLRFLRHWAVVATKRAIPVLPMKLPYDLRRDQMTGIGLGIKAVRIKGKSGYVGRVDGSPEYFEMLEEKMFRFFVTGPAEKIASLITDHDFGDYPPVLKRIERLIAKVNKRRQALGLKLVSRRSVRLKGKRAKRPKAR